MTRPQGTYFTPHAAGKTMGIYADVPIKRCCECLDPSVYEDEEGDPVCFKCGHQLNPPLSAAQVSELFEGRAA